LKNSNTSDSNLLPIIGYGIFITHNLWRDKAYVEVCRVKNFTRIYPKGSWFPYALKSAGSFKALKFAVNKVEIKLLDEIEGVDSGLFKRVMVDILLKNNRPSSAFMYVPTEETIASQKLTLESDKIDRWKEEIKKIPEIVRNFPDLFM